MISDHITPANGPRCPVCGTVLGQVTGVTPSPVWLCVRADQVHRNAYFAAWSQVEGVRLGDPVNGQFGTGNMFAWDTPAIIAQAVAQERDALASAAADAPVTSHQKPRL